MINARACCTLHACQHARSSVVADRGRWRRRRAVTHAPRILLLYGSLRERSYSRLLTRRGRAPAAAMGAETRIFDPRGLPLPDGAPETHPKVQELRELAQWAEGMVWTPPSATAR